MEDSSFKFGIIRNTSMEKSNILTISELCEIAGVSRSGYYAWLSSEQKRAAREARDAADFQQILEAYRFRGYAKGVRGIHMRLLHTGIRMNGKKIRRLMKKFGLVCPIRKANPYRRMQKAIRTNNTAENLGKREFEMHGPRSVLLTDITYIPLNGAFCYLSTILDGCTKQVLSYVLSESLEVDFVLETVQKMVHQHGNFAKKRDNPAQRPGLPLHLHQVHSAREKQSPAAVNVAEGKLLGQRAAGELFRTYEGRVGAEDSKLDVLCGCAAVNRRLDGLL